MARRKPSDTPLMRQFLEVKETHPEGIVFFRMGDFYEMFFEDAVVASQLLDLTLTSRNKGKEDSIPMAGLPHHAAKGYIAKLTNLGHKVVLVEQVEDPKLAKGLVKREVVRIITPGVVLDEDVLEPNAAHFVAGIIATEPGAKKSGWALAYVDVSTGEFRGCELASTDALIGELNRVAPREIVTPDGQEIETIKARYPATFSSHPEPKEPLQEAITGVSGSVAQRRVGELVLAYAKHTQPAGDLPVTSFSVYCPEDTVVLDEAAVCHLELTETLMDKKRAGSLLHAIDRTKTAPGARKLRRWLLYPLTDVAAIRRRQDAVQFFFDRTLCQREIRETLKSVSDLERLAGRFTLGVATPRCLGKLRDTIGALPKLAGALEKPKKKAVGFPDSLVVPKKCFAELAKLGKELTGALSDELPAALKDGGLIRDGFCPEVDEHRELATGGKEAVLKIESRERESTGISTLKVKYNRVFGYYLEVTKSQLDRVPESYVRKQTVANAERFVTPELAELEGKILSAEELLSKREAELFRRLCKMVGERRETILTAADYVAGLDCFAGLSVIAEEKNYVRPEVDASDVLEITEGRHPVVENMVESGAYVPNDCTLNCGERQLLLITGPNMAGKSTYMRQVAHIVLLAQMGSYVPANAARIGVVDRVFTRVGAADNLARGESTFMVEMRETASILSGATGRSLLILDEIGRGTSTYDGVSIAWSVAEFIHDSIGARALFATHYHELSALAEERDRVHCVSVAAREHQGKIVFLHRVVEGGTNRSYGIDVGRLAGLPSSVVERAREILVSLEEERVRETGQLDLFSLAGAKSKTGKNSSGGVSENKASVDTSPATKALLSRLNELDISNTTPLAALTVLDELQRMTRN